MNLKYYLVYLTDDSLIIFDLKSEPLLLIGINSGYTALQFPDLHSYKIKIFAYPFFSQSLCQRNSVFCWHLNNFVVLFDILISLDLTFFLKKMYCCFVSLYNLCFRSELFILPSLHINLKFKFKSINLY